MKTGDTLRMETGVYHSFAGIEPTLQLEASNGLFTAVSGEILVRETAALLEKMKEIGNSPPRQGLGCK